MNKLPLLKQQLHPAGASEDFPRRVRIDAHQIEIYTFLKLPNACLPLKNVAITGAMCATASAEQLALTSIMVAWSCAFGHCC
jgi:hypothetical protein